jgi:ankyrin repeat protein
LPDREQHQFLDICRNGDFERVKEYLTVNPLYINVQPGGRWSALHQFAYHGDSEAIQYLLDKLADPSAKTTEGHTPAEVAQDRVAALLGTKGTATKARTSTSLQMVGLLCTPCFVKKAPVRPPNA